jgi:CHAT domain-containing protein
LNPGTPLDAFGHTAWPALQGTSAEIDAIATMWLDGNPPALLKGTDASEATLRERLPGSRFVHLATHGFFADPDSRPEPRRWVLPPSDDLGKLGRRLTVTARNPLLLSGVVLAGANAAQQDSANGASSDDGILTAEEVAAVDLSKTELVVLSACETGLGKVAGGEGVFGLQRAFGLAGARTVIASLWKVDDDATRALMAEFYRNLWRQPHGSGKLEALRRAQLAMMRGYDVTRGQLQADRGPVPGDPPPCRSLPPFYWAAFTLDGDWR